MSEKEHSQGQDSQQPDQITDPAAGTQQTHHDLAELTNLTNLTDQQDRTDLDAEHTEELLKEGGISLSLSGDWKTLLVSPEDQISGDLRQALNRNYDIILRNQLIRSSVRFIEKTIGAKCGTTDHPAARAAHEAMIETQKDLIASCEDVVLDDFKNSLRAWITSTMKAMNDELSRSPSHSQTADQSSTQPDVSAHDSKSPESPSPSKNQRPEQVEGQSSGQAVTAEHQSDPHQQALATLGPQTTSRQQDAQPQQVDQAQMSMAI